jgi:hypothetical protein
VRTKPWRADLHRQLAGEQAGQGSDLIFLAALLSINLGTSTCCPSRYWTARHMFFFVLK